MKQVFVNFALWVDGTSYVGQAKELVTPKITSKTLGYTAGGMAGELKVPMANVEAMEASGELIGYNTEVLEKLGFVFGKVVPIDGRGAVTAEDGTVKQVRVAMRGHLTEAEPGTWKPADETSLKFKMDLTYFRLEEDGRVRVEVDIDNAILVVGGEDQMAAVRTALGI